MIILINPNSTVSMTEAMVDTARKTRPDSKIVGWTSHAGPPAIQGPQDGEAAVPPLLELVKKANADGATAIIIGCSDDTGLDEARAMSPCPVIGIGQAGYHMACLASPRFSVVTTLAVSVPILAGNIESYGLGQQMAKVRASGVPVLALETDRTNATAQVMAEIDKARQEDDIGAVVLGCAGMVHIIDAYAETYPIRLIDGVRAATQIASTF
ncbi:aspartate/glutamate racemase family protein [Yoonia sediminilitoris]|uniref:Allantoin racemase n=1 Tax=Yoonia sediminilitoris TaxID=1286148 RepID=A0A2T6KIL1_9RHOB|nr:aspartate/glutamate racemase family protein [Yoonia sediminilitoris]PUB15538.1 allantoin racemase [Yoonia sediminilitoris]RCW96147.1 allantoin racemase [Yoonia sediminilitoris]